jgi:DNA-binding Xre family transcriptional regulator
MEIIRRVSAAMADASISKIKLADLAAIPYTTLHRKLKGQTAFTLDDILVIAQALRVNPSDLLQTQFTEDTSPTITVTTATAMPEPNDSNADANQRGVVHIAPTPDRTIKPENAP